MSSHDGHTSCKQGLHTIAIRVLVNCESRGSASCDSKADCWSEWSEGLQVNAETPRMPKRPSTSSSGSSKLHPHLPKDYYRFLFRLLPVARSCSFKACTPNNFSRFHAFEIAQLDLAVSGPLSTPEVSISCLMQAKEEINARDTQTARCIGLVG